jgi:hypothetical protein
MLESLLRRLFRTGTRRGLGGSRAWTIIAVATGAVRLLRRIAHPKPEVLWRQQLRPGDRFEVTVRAPDRR